MGLSYGDIEILRNRVAFGMTEEQVCDAIGEPYASTFALPICETYYRTALSQLTLRHLVEEDRVIEIHIRSLTAEERAKWEQQHRDLTDKNSAYNQQRLEIDKQHNEINLRIRSSPYSTREKAEFTDANDHNPTILQTCPKCGGAGKVSAWETVEEGTQLQLPPMVLSTSYHPGDSPDESLIHYLAVCSTCCGLKTTGHSVPYFDNNAEPLEAVLRSSGRTLCPFCKKNFNTKNACEWTGRRHISCGQKLYFRDAVGEENEDERAKTPWGKMLCPGCEKRLSSWADTKNGQCGYCRRPIESNVERK